MEALRWKTITRWLAGAGMLAAIVLFFRHLPAVNATTVVLTLLLYILVLAARWGLQYALVASVAATACYNFYFLPPIGSFAVADPQNWLALLAFLCTAVVASRLSVRVKAGSQEALSRQREIEVLYRLSRELLQTDRVSELLEYVPATIVQVAGAEAALMYLTEGDRAYAHGGDGFPNKTELQHLAESAHVSQVGARDVAIPLRSGVRPRGVLLVRALGVSTETQEAIGSLVSISIDRAQAMEELARSEGAKASEKLRSMMLDSITHELRTPLTAIKASATTMLAAGAIAEEDRRDLLQVINEEADRLNRLVAQAVEMAQLDSHEVQMQMAPMALQELVERSLEACESCMAGHGIAVRIPREISRVLVDGVWMQKVLCNLVENAAKYSAAGSPIEISAETQAESVLLRVRDYGFGIDREEHSLIFNKFYRGRARASSVPGTGMGLAICRAIVEAHGGTISVDSEPLQGSTFTVALPAVAGSGSRG